MGIEPTSSAWKADILADVRCPRILFFPGCKQYYSMIRGKCPAFFAQSAEEEETFAAELAFACLLWSSFIVK